MKRLFLAAVALAGISFFGSPAKADDPLVVYHATKNWNGYPANKTVSGWHVVLIGSDVQGANTGVMAFVMKWDASRSCWGEVRDCRSPSWAAAQKLSYVGPVQSTTLFSEVLK